MEMSRDKVGDVRKYTWAHKSQRQSEPQQRPVRTMVTRSQRSPDPGLLCGLPAELLHMLLDTLSVLEISVFSMVSKEMAGYVVDYISSMAWKNKNIVSSFHNNMYLEQRCTVQHYRELGLLFKRCTLLLPTKERLKFVFCMFSQVPCFVLEQCIAPHCAGFSRYGAFLKTLIAGWDELECYRVFNFLCDFTNLLQKTEAVISAKPGVKRFQELQLRLFCRQVLLDSWQNESECQFWLIQLLKPWPMVSQAHLLFILYGPLLPEGALGWQALVERGLPHGALWDMAKAILMLFGKVEVKGWTTDSMLVIIEELIAVPEPWHVENVARLLVLCGSRLCYTVLASKALGGRVSEISTLFIYIILVCEKDGYHMSWAVKLVQQICKVFTSTPEKFCFIQQLENKFSEVTKEFLDSNLTGNHFEDAETFHTLSILLDSSAHFHTKLLHMLLK